MAKPSRPFPRHTIEESLVVPRALKEYNGGNAWAPSEVAGAVGSTPMSTKFFYLTAAARDYGLTEGTRDAAAISLTELGRQVVYPTSPESEAAGLHQSFRTIEPFAQVLDHFGGSALPEKKFLQNTLETQMNLLPEWHDDFIRIYKENCRFLGIGDNYDGAPPAGSSDSGIESSVTRTLATRDGAPGCFVIMPFVERDEAHEAGFFEEVLRSIFTPALEKAGFEVRTAKRTGSDVIQATIVKELLGADLVLADLTEHNPNVLFELGLRIAEEKPIVLVKAKGTGRVFDVDNMLRVEEYSPNLWTSTVATDIPKLTDHILGAWERRSVDPSFLSIVRGQSLT
jgi:hypothetical protein